MPSDKKPKGVSGVINPGGPVEQLQKVAKRVEKDGSLDDGLAALARKDDSEAPTIGGGRRDEPATGQKAAKKHSAVRGGS